MEYLEGAPGGVRRGGVPPPWGGVPGGPKGPKSGFPRGGIRVCRFLTLFIGDLSGAFGLAGLAGGSKRPKKGQKGASGGGPTPPRGGPEGGPGGAQTPPQGGGGPGFRRL